MTRDWLPVDLSLGGTLLVSSGGHMGCWGLHLALFCPPTPSTKASSSVVTHRWYFIAASSTWRECSLGLMGFPCRYPAANNPAIQCVLSFWNLRLEAEHAKLRKVKVMGGRINIRCAIRQVILMVMSRVRIRGRKKFHDYYSYRAIL